LGGGFVLGKGWGILGDSKKPPEGGFLLLQITLLTLALV